MPAAAKPMKATIYHNTKCSKSNAALSLLLEQGVDVDIVSYLETPLCSERLKALLSQLEMHAKDLIRFAEPIAIELGITRADIRNEDQWLAYMMEHPILIERPIVVIKNMAIIARPAELVLVLIKRF